MGKKKVGKVAARKRVRALVEAEAYVAVIVRRPYVCVMAFAWHDGKLWSDAGFSKCNWPDWYSEEQGIRIAKGRALDGITRQIRGEKERTERLLTAEDLYQIAKLRLLENSTQSVEAALVGTGTASAEAVAVEFRRVRALVQTGEWVNLAESGDPPTGYTDAERVADFEEKLEHVG